MQTLSTEAEERLIGCLKEAVAMVDDKQLSPTSALTKIASREKWGAEMIRFASHAYNTGRQTSQRESATSILDKMASFQLADPDKIIAEVFPSHVKSASQVDVESRVSPEYLQPPRFLEVRAQQQRLKAARDSVLPVSKPLPPVVDAKTAMAREYNQYLRQKQAAEMYRHEAAVAYEGLLGKVGSLADYFRQSPRDRVSFAVFEKVAQLEHPSSKLMLDYIYKRNRMKEARADAKTSLLNVRTDPSQAPWSLLKSAMTQARVASEKQAEHQAFVATAVKTANDRLSPYEQTHVDRVVGWDLLSGPIKEKRAAGFLAGALGGTVATRTQGIIDDAVKDKTKEMVSDKTMELEDPDHDAALRQIQVQSMLADMMNDDVIGGHPPEHVMNAYNEISQMAPRASTQPIAMRALLRRALQGNIEPFEAKEMTELEKGMRDTEAPPGAASKGIMGNESSIVQ